MKLFKSAVFWILFGSLILAIALFFLTPLMHLQSVGTRLLVASLPLIVGIIVALIVKLLQMGKALKSGDAAAKPTSKNPFDAALAVQPWIDALRKETDEVLGILKSTGKGKAGVGQNPLDVFRFYLMLGGMGSGKTSLLENSGVNFPRRFPAVADLARQNRSFTQWWMSSLGIFLETPYRYLTGEEGDEEFTAFLKLIEAEGKKTTLDGILLTVSLREVIQSAERLPELAARYRDHVALVQSQLRLELPVYVVFTHADLLPGFTDFFTNLRDPDSQQVLGATFALKGNFGPVRQRFEREFKRIWDNLHARTPYRLAQVTDIGQKQRIFAFANEFGAAQERLGTFLEHLFKETMNRERPLFRGFFLTSVTADGQSVGTADPFAQAQAAQVFHPLDPRAKLAKPMAMSSAAAAGPSTRSLFTHLIFSGVLKNDGSLARFPGYRLGSVSRRSLLLGGATALVSLLLLAWGIGGYFVSTSRLHALGNLTVAAGQLRFAQPSQFPNEFAVLDSLLQRIRVLQEGGEGGWLLPPGFGHNAEAIRLASRTHQAQMDRLIARPAMRTLSASLEVGASNFFASQHGALHDQLKMYLLLTPSGREHLEELKPEEFGAQLNAFWAPELGSRMGIENLPPDFESAFEEHSRFFAEELIAGRRSPVEKADDRVVQDVRKALMGMPSIEGLFSSIVSSVEASKDLTLQDMGVPADAILKSSARVRGLFTKAVFDEDAMSRLGDGAEAPHRKDWVLGDNVTMALPPEMQDQQQLYRALVDRYFQEYATEWTRFLQSLSVRVPPEPAIAAGKLSGYASATQGLPAVMGRVLNEVNLLAPPSQAQQAAEKSKLATGKLGKLAKMAMQNRDADKVKLKDQFRFLEELSGAAGGGVLQDYLAAVKGLSEVLSRISLSGDAAGETMQAAQQLFQGKTESPLNFCWNEANKVKARYEGQTWLFPLLEGPVRDVAIYLADAVGKQLEASYQQKVMGFYNQNLRGRYPMLKTGPQEANLDDLKGFFNPENGVFATFVNGKLQYFVKEGDDGYTVRAWNGVRLPFRASALQAMYRTVQVNRRLYTENPPALRIYTMNLTLPEVRNTARITFRLGDDRISVKPGEGQARATLRWPNENTYKGAEILVENVGSGSQGRRIDGSWGLMKLMDASRALNLRPGGFSAKWRFNVASKYDVDVLLDANLTERDNPFSTPDYLRFELPTTLLEPGASVSGSAGGG